MGDLRDGLEVGHVELGIADGFDVERAGLGGDGLAEGSRVARVDEFDRAAQLGERVVEELVGAAVEVVARHDFVAEAGDGQQGVGDGRLSGGDGEGAGAAFERRDALFEHVGRGVHQPRIDVAEFLQREKIRRVFRTLEHVGRGLVDGDRARSGRRIRLLSRMQ